MGVAIPGRYPEETADDKFARGQYVETVRVCQDGVCSVQKLASANF